MLSPIYDCSLMFDADVARRIVSITGLSAVTVTLFADAREIHRTTKATDDFLPTFSTKAGPRVSVSNPWSSAFSVVAAGEQRGNDEAAFTAGHGLPGLAGSFMSDRHGYPREGRAWPGGGDRAVELRPSATALGESRPC